MSEDKGYSPRSEISLLNPSGKPMIFRFGTVPNSLVYALPIYDTAMDYQFLKSLRETFPEDKGFGLITKKYSNRIKYELVFSTVDERTAALSIPITFEYKKRAYTFNPMKVIYGARDIYQVTLSSIPIKDFEHLKIQISENLSPYGSIIDIVLYKDDPTGSWFTGNGYVIMTCSIPRKKRKPHSISIPGGMISISWNLLGDTEKMWSYEYKQSSAGV